MSNQITGALKAHPVPGTLKYGPLELDRVHRRASREGCEPVYLKPAEEKLLATFMIAHRGFVSKHAAYDALYWDRGSSGEPDPQVLAVFLCHLRKKLKKLGFRFDCIYASGWELREGLQ